MTHALSWDSFTCIRPAHSHRHTHTLTCSCTHTACSPRPGETLSAGGSLSGHQLADCNPRIWCPEPGEVGDWSLRARPWGYTAGPLPGTCPGTPGPPRCLRLSVPPAPSPSPRNHSGHGWLPQGPLQKVPASGSPQASGYGLAPRPSRRRPLWPLLGVCRAQACLAACKRHFRHSPHGSRWALGSPGSAPAARPAWLRGPASSAWPCPAAFLEGELMGLVKP